MLPLFTSLCINKNGYYTRHNAHFASLIDAKIVRLETALIVFAIPKKLEKE